MENKQRKLDRVFLNIAFQMSTLSHCVSHKVGAVITLNNRIIATGINGSAAGYPNCDEVFEDYNSNLDREQHHEWSIKNEIHAELNALLFCARNGIKTEEATLYCTIRPCDECTKNLLQSGIKRIVYDYDYDKTNLEQTNKLFSFVNIKIEKFGNDNEK